MTFRYTHEHIKACLIDPSHKDETWVESCEVIINQLLSENSTLKQQLDMAVNGLELYAMRDRNDRIKLMAMHPEEKYLISHTDAAEQAIAKIKQLGGGE